MPAQTNKLKNELLKVLGNYFGSETLRLFNNFYTTPDEVMENTEKMLEALIGKESAQAELGLIYKKYKIKRAAWGKKA